MYYSKFPPLSQGGDGAHARLSIIDGALIDTATGEVFGPVPAIDRVDSEPQNPNCAFIDTLGPEKPSFAMQVNDLQNGGSEIGRFDTLYVRDASNSSTLKVAPKPSGTEAHGACECTVDRRRNVRLSGHCTDRGTPWNRTRMFAGHKVSKRVITPEQRREIIAAAEFSLDRKTPLNIHVALKPPTDHMTPVERMDLWPTYRQRWRVFCQNHGIECLMVCVRESDPDTHMGEHDHWLVYAPMHLHEKAIHLIEGWCENAFAEAVDIRGKTVAGKVKSIVSYITKAAAPQDTFRDPSILYRKSGAVLGPRTFVTMNLRAKAREKAEPLVKAARRIRKERNTLATMLRKARQHDTTRNILGTRESQVDLDVYTEIG